MMHNVHSPAASPVKPDTGRLVKEKLPAARGNVPTGKAATVRPLCASVPRRMERKSWRPEMFKRTPAESPVPVTFNVVHALPLSTSARFGVAEPDQFVGFMLPLQSPVIDT